MGADSEWHPLHINTHPCMLRDFELFTSSLSDALCLSLAVSFSFTYTYITLPSTLES